MSTSTSTLLLCGGCSRHFRARDERCPFCGASSSHARARPRPAALQAGAARSRRHAARALIASSAMVACSADFTSTSRIGDKDGGGGSGNAGTGGRSAGGGTNTGGRINGTGGRSTGGGLGPGGASGAGTGGFSTGGAIVIGNGGIGGGQTCNGATNPAGTPCRTPQDCTATGAGGVIGGFGPWYCYLTVPSRGCGNPNFQPQQCNWPPATNCPDGGICQTTDCGGHLCIAPCDPAVCNGTSACVNGLCEPKRCDEPGAAPCTAGFECNPADPTGSTLGCVPIHCTTASDCDPGYDCSASAQGKGCVHRPCTIDTDCNCGYCVNAFCEATLGFCYQIVATPYGCVWPDEELV